MRQFNYKKLAKKQWDNEIVLLCSKIHECKGRQELFVRQKPAQLDRLIEIARIQSTEASNRIEGIVNGDADALLALTHAECAAEFNLVAEIVLRDKLLQLLYHLTGTLDVAG